MDIFIKIEFLQGNVFLVGEFYLFIRFIFVSSKFVILVFGKGIYYREIYILY